MRILVINQYYTPDRAATGLLLGDLAEGLVAQGTEVVVVCGQPSYTEDASIRPQVEIVQPGLEVRRVTTAGFQGRRSLVTRDGGYVGFLAAARAEIARVGRSTKFDLVVTASNPPFVGLLGRWFKQRFGVPFVYLLHDLHPDILLRSGQAHLPGPLVHLWNRQNRQVFSGADRIVVLGEGMKQILTRDKGVPEGNVCVIHNWAHPELSPGDKKNEFRGRLGIGPDQVAVVYSGNMGVSHNLEWLLQAAEKLRDLPLSFVFVGGGAKEAELKRLAASAGLDNVSFLPYQDEATYPQVLAAADVAVVALEPGLEGLAVPSKTYSILAAGRPVLAIMRQDSDVGHLVAETNCGWVTETPGEVAEVLRAVAQNRGIAEERGRRARAAYEAQFSLGRAVRQYSELFEEVVGG